MDRLALIEKFAGLLQPDQPRARDLVPERGPEGRKKREAIRDKLRESCPAKPAELNKEALSSGLLDRARKKALSKATQAVNALRSAPKSRRGALEAVAKKRYQQSLRFASAGTKKEIADTLSKFSGVKLAAMADELQKIWQ